MPAHVRVGVGKWDRCVVSVGAGPTASFRLNARQRLVGPNVDITEDFTEDTIAVDLGLTAGARVEAGRDFWRLSVSGDD